MEGTHAQTVSYPLKDLYKLCVWNELDDKYEEKIGENVSEEQRFLVAIYWQWTYPRVDK